MSGCRGMPPAASNSVTKPQEASRVRRQRERPRESIIRGEPISQRAAIHQASQTSSPVLFHASTGNSHPYCINRGLGHRPQYLVCDAMKPACRGPFRPAMVFNRCDASIEHGTGAAAVSVGVMSGRSLAGRTTCPARCGVATRVRHRAWPTRASSGGEQAVDG
jgi:hypothetical protein